MKNKSSKKIKALIFDVCLLAIDCMVLYKMMFGEGDIAPATTAFMATVLFISVPLFVYINYSAFANGKTVENAMNVNDLDTYDEFVAAFGPFRRDRFLSKYAEAAVRQLFTLDKKTSTIEQVLVQNFSQGIEEFEVVNQVVNDSRDAVYANMREVINRMTIFEGLAAYNSSSVSGGINGNIMAEKERMVNSHIEFILSVLNNNEIIFLELDKLMIEITKMNDQNQNSDKTIGKIKDIVGSLQMLHNADSSEYVNIAKAYDEVSVPELENLKSETKN